VARHYHDREVIFAVERAVLCKIRDVTIERVDRERRTIAASFGAGDKSLRMTNLPLAESISIRVPYVFPGSVNHVPFSWDRLERLVHKRVSMMLGAEAGGRSVDSIAVAND
jgi:hypothetical protein